MVRREHSEKQMAYQEIKQLQDLISEMEKTIQRLTEDVTEAKQHQENQKGQISELDTQRRVYEERLALKDKEVQSYIDAKEEIMAQMAKL